MIVGVSTRALAESAARAGYECATVDAFGDLDQRTYARNVALLRDYRRPYTAARAVALARSLPGSDAAYVANLENHPSAVRRLSAGRRLLGNPPRVLRRIRDPFALAEVVRGGGGAFPETLPPEAASAADPARCWLRKPRRGGGGSGVRRWRPGDALATWEVLQERVDGVPCSALLAADGRHAAVLGLTRQLVGDPRFGARGFQYCGNLFPLVPPVGRSGPEPEPERLAPPALGADAGSALLLRAQMAELADALTAAFGLRGLCGIDFVLADGTAWVLEVNPRPTAAMELVERALGLSIFETHRRASLGELPEVPSDAPDAVYGKAVLFARQDLTLPDTHAWLERDDIRDVPFPGEVIRRGWPVCTVFARGADAAACEAALACAAAAVEGEIEGAPSPPGPFSHEGRAGSGPGPWG